jgi:transposase
MTTKQIAEAIGRPEKTVRTWAARAAAISAASTAKMAEGTPGKPVDWNLDETVEIIAVGLGRNAALIWRENALRVNQPAPALDIAAIVRETIAALLPTIVTALRGAPASPAALPPPAELEPRAALRKIVEAWARKHGRDYHGAWSSLYREYGYRYHRDIVRAAKNRDQSVLDYAESETILGELLALAFFLYGQQEAA